MEGIQITYARLFLLDSVCEHRCVCLCIYKVTLRNYSDCASHYFVHILLPIDNNFIYLTTLYLIRSFELFRQKIICFIFLLEFKVYRKLQFRSLKTYHGNLRNSLTIDICSVRCLMYCYLFYRTKCVYPKAKHFAACIFCKMLYEPQQKLHL